MSGKWNETETYKEKFYNNAKNKIPSNILDEIHKIDFRNIPKGAPKLTNETLGSILRSLGWADKGKCVAVSSLRLDHFKNHVGLEKELRTDRDLLYDVLKLQLGYVLGNLISGIIITYDKDVRVKGGNKPYLQKLDRKIEQFQKVIKFTIPLLVIGLKEKNFETKKVPERHVKYPVALRGPSYQRYLEKLRKKRKNAKYKTLP